MMSQGGSGPTYSQIKKSFEVPQSLDSTLNQRSETLRLFIKYLPLQMSTRGKRNLSKMSYCKTLNNCQKKIIRKLPLNIFAEVKPIMMSTKFGTAVQFSVKLCCDF